MSVSSSTIKITGLALSCSDTHSIHAFFCQIRFLGVVTTVCQRTNFSHGVFVPANLRQDVQRTSGKTWHLAWVNPNVWNSGCSGACRLVSPRASCPGLPKPHFLIVAAWGRI